MDRNLYTDDFERLLKEKSDEFRMYPSKRIWYSIYNNIHPGRKWPSIAMGIMLMGALMLIGYLNTDIQFNSAGSLPFSDVAPVRPPLAHFNDQQNSGYLLPFPQYTTEQSNSKNETRLSPVSKNVSKGTKGPVNYSQSGETATNMVTSNTNTLSNTIPASPAPGEITSTNMTRRQEMKKDFTDKLSHDESAINIQETSARMEAPGRISISNPVTAVDLQENLLFAASNKTVENQKEIKGSANAPLKNIISKEDQEWIDHYALYNRPVPRKWVGKLAWDVYATPSIVYRTLDTDYGFGITSTSAPFVIPANNREINTQVNNKPSLGLEAGVGLQFPILKSVRIKTGLQLNFTRYNSNAYHNAHPVATKLTMHDYTANSTYEIFRTTPYSNKTGLDAVKLHNETFQVSLPIGIDLKLLGSDNLQWNVGATIQPTYLLAGKSYLISSDRRNYVKESSMLNRWNLNAGFETFITYKKNGITYHIGPQFRRQIFSTNSKRFAIEERLVNYGIKFGVVKLLK